MLREGLLYFLISINRILYIKHVNLSTDRERRKKSDGRSRGEENPQPMIADEMRSASKGRERPNLSDDVPRRDFSDINPPRPSSSQRVSRDEIPARPSSSQRRSEAESKERVVRDTVSFNRVDASATRSSPIPVQPIVSSRSKG